MNQETRQCQNCHQDFTIEPEDFDFYGKIGVPAPTWCPDCRFMRHLIWRNEKTFYKRKDELTGKEIFSMFHPDAPLKTYDHAYWWSDAWDASDYGRPYDFSKPFFEQLKELMRAVPWFSRSVIDIVNSDYAMTSGHLKNCYMVFDSDNAEDCLYSTSLTHVKDCADNLLMIDCELCYGNFAGANNNRVFYSIDSGQCLDVWFCQECDACSHCVGCRNLRHKQYCILNKQYTKEKYAEEFKKLRLNTRSGRAEFEKRFREFSLKFPIKAMLESHNVDCSGDFITYSKNVKKSYLIRDGENLRYCQSLYTPPGSRDSYDYTIWGGNAERIYECCQVGEGASDISFSMGVYPNCIGIRYSIMCSFSNNVFGCVGMKRKQYCILNKQYTKEEYEELVPKIRKHMDEMPYTDAKGRVYKYGEFFPPELSPFAYNETMAQEYFPITKQDAAAKGFLWREPAEKPHQPTKSWRELPETIGETDDSILKETILCRAWDENEERALEHNCTKAFRITPEELAFYRRLDIPLPERCFYSRHHERTKHRNPVQFWPRSCMCGGVQSSDGKYANTAKHSHGDGPCGEKFETSFAPDRPEIVYCESCFNAEFI